MTPVGRLGPSCVCGCGRPARELGGFATACWMGLLPAERLFLQEHGDEPTEPIDVLEQAWELPARDPGDLAA